MAKEKIEPLAVDMGKGESLTGMIESFKGQVVSAFALPSEALRGQMDGVRFFERPRDVGRRWFTPGGRQYGESPAMGPIRRLRELQDRALALLDVTPKPLFVSEDAARDLMTYGTTIQLPTDETLLREMTTAQDAAPPMLTVEAIMRARELLMQNHVPVPEDGSLFIGRGADAHEGSNGFEIDLRPGAVNVHYGSYQGLGIQNFIRESAGRLGYGFMDTFGDELPRPETATPFSWMTGTWIMEMTVLGSTARCITDDQKLWDEAEAMKHCIYRSYRQKIAAGTYAAFHVDCPHLSKNGFTIGFQAEHTVHDDRLNARLVRETSWFIDQIKGRKNRSCSHHEVISLAHVLADNLNVRFKKREELHDNLNGSGKNAWREIAP